MSTGVTLERYAELRAEIETGRLRDDALAVAGLTVEEWAQAQRDWLQQMGAELEHGRFELTNRYTQAFLARQRSLVAPSIAAPSMELPSPDMLPPREEIPIAVPAFMAASTAPSTRSPWERHAATDAFAATDPVTPAAPPLHGLTSNAGDGTQTLWGALASPLPVLPFDSDGLQATHSLASADPTATVFLAEGWDLSESLSPAGRSSPPVRTQDDGTETIFGAAPSPLATLPFTPGTPPPAAAPQAPLRPAAPVSSVLPLTVQGRTLEQHASLCAEIAFNPADADETLVRYRVTAEEKAEMDRQWKVHFAADEVLNARFHGAYRTYFEFLSQRRK